jgi:hypothetical protein
MATLNLGRIKPVFRGAYAGGTAYVIDDIVTSGGETFICIQASTGNATSSASHWTKLAEKGTNGSNGSNGTDLSTTLTTQGDILYRDGSGLQRLPKGTAGQVLQMNSGATAPEYATAQGGRTVQMKALKFADQINYSANSWGDLSHPLGDGTIQITPKSQYNLIKLDMNTSNTGGQTWCSTAYRFKVSTDSGSNWDYVTSSSNGAAGGVDIYNESTTVTSTFHNQWFHVAQNTNAHRFKIQGYGRSGGGGDKINQDSFGSGSEVSRLILTEIDMTGSDFTSGDL